MNDAAQEKSNGAFDSNITQDSIRMRKKWQETLARNQSKEQMENIETRNGMDSPEIITAPEENETVKNAAVFQQIALTRVKNHASVCYNLIGILLMVFLNDAMFLSFNRNLKSN